MDLSGVFCLEKEPWVQGAGAPWGSCDVPCEFHPSHPPPTPNPLFPPWHGELLTPRKWPQGVVVTWKIRAVRGYMSWLCSPGISWAQDGSCCRSLLDPLGELQAKTDFLFFKHCKEGWIKVGRCFILSSVAERNLFIFWVSLFPECFVARTCSRAVLSTFLQISFW